MERQQINNRVRFEKPSRSASASASATSSAPLYEFDGSLPAVKVLLCCQGASPIFRQDTKSSHVLGDIGYIICYRVRNSAPNCVQRACYKMAWRWIVSVYVVQCLCRMQWSALPGREILQMWRWLNQVEGSLSHFSFSFSHWPRPLSPCMHMPIS